MMNLAVKRWHVQGLLCSCSLWYWNLARGLTLLSGSETKHTPSFPLDLNFAVTICYSFVLWPESISHASYARVVTMKTTLLHTQEKCACHNHLIKGSKKAGARAPVPANWSAMFTQINLSFCLSMWPLWLICTRNLDTKNSYGVFLEHFDDLTPGESMRVLMISTHTSFIFFANLLDKAT